MAKQPPSAQSDLDAAYGLKTPDDSRALYRDWAASYDCDFAQATGYLLPEAVAAEYAALGGAGPVLDIGAGTGLVGIALHARGIGPVDGVDISPEMLAQAGRKAVYRVLSEADITRAGALPAGAYAGIVSAGTFTCGHVGPEAFDALVEAARPGALFVLSVNAAHWEPAGFAAKIAALDAAIDAVRRKEMPIYAEGGAGSHSTDRAYLLSFRRKGA